MEKRKNETERGKDKTNYFRRISRDGVICNILKRRVFLSLEGFLKDPLRMKINVFVEEKARGGSTIILGKF